MKFDTTAGYDMDGGGTSASTPQIAAACALWLEENKANYSADWTRVQACRFALFNGADKTHNQDPALPVDQYFGQGLLHVPTMLEVAVDGASLVEEPPDTVSSPVWRIAMDIGPPSNDEELMYEVEAAQITARSSNLELRLVTRDVPTRPAGAERRTIREIFASEPDVSQAFKRRLEGG
ncbi:MAG: hypothetical protein WB041_23140 [Pseudolabrys sp.]